MLWFGALAVGAMAGVLVALSASGLSFLGNGGLTVANSDLVEAAITPEVGANPDDSAAEQADVAGAADAGQATTSTTFLAIAPPVSLDPEVDLWSADLPVSPTDVAILATNGVFSSRRTDSRLASFIAIDGMILTSAAAVDASDRHVLRIDGKWADVELVATDSYTDIAVLQPIDTIDGELMDYADERNQPLAGMKVYLQVAPTSGAPVTTDDWGFVSVPGEVVVTTLNRHCYDALTTSLPASTSPPGSAVINDVGEIVGITISTPQPTAAIVPINVAVDVARRMADVGVAAESKIGVVANLDGAGKTRVETVTTSGPAADRLQVDDVIVSVDGEPVQNPDHLVYLVRQVEAYADVEIIVERNDAVETVVVRTTSPADH